jgi:hypothetical protein
VIKILRKGCLFLDGDKDLINNISLEPCKIPKEKIKINPKIISKSPEK